MSQPEILRHAGPHQVSVAVGSKNAQGRQAVERTPLEESPKAELTDIEWHNHADPAPADAQLSDSAADSENVWIVDQDMSLRVDQLKKRNLDLGIRLQRMIGSGRKEEKIE